MQASSNSKRRPVLSNRVHKSWNDDDDDFVTLCGMSHESLNDDVSIYGKLSREYFKPWSSVFPTTY